MILSVVADWPGGSAEYRNVLVSFNQKNTRRTCYGIRWPLRHFVVADRSCLAARSDERVLERGTFNARRRSETVASGSATAGRRKGG
jgi:hypothetical protein